MISYFENTFPTFIMEQFLISFVVFATINAGPSLLLFLDINSMAYFSSVHHLSDELE